MSATVETLEKLERKLIVSLPWSDINAETDKRIKQTQRRVKIDGFRPGKAPLKMVASMYGAGIQNDVMNDLAQDVFWKEVETQNLRVAALERVEPVEEQKDEANFQVGFVFEAMPEIKIADLSALSIEKVVAEVKDEDVERTIEILRKQRTRFDRVEREAQDGDRVIIDFEGKIDGEVFAGGEAKNYPFVLGQGQMLPEFEAGVKGLKEGESKDVEVSFPEDYHGKDVAGKTAVFAITVNNVAEAILPEVNADFARSLGIEDGDVSKMREEVEKNISRELKRRLDAQNAENVMNALREAHSFDLPKAFVREESERLANAMNQNFAQPGLDTKDSQLPADMFTEAAERRVSLGLLLPTIIEENKLDATEEQIKEIVSSFAESYEDPQEVIDWYFADKQRLQGASNLAVEANVVNFVLGQAKVSEKNLSFDEVMGTNV